MTYKLEGVSGRVTG